MAKNGAAREAEVASRVLRHWHEAVPNDRIAHLVKDATRAFLRSLQIRLARHNVQLGHWAFLRVLWQRDGITKRELSFEAGVMEPTTVVALRSMEELGYVSLRQLPENRKNIYVFLTPPGKAAQKGAGTAGRGGQCGCAGWVVRHRRRENPQGASRND